MTTIRRSYAIFRQSLAILGQDKELLVFPLLSGIITIVAFVTMAFAGVTSGLFARIGDNSPAAYAVLFVWYFVSWFIVLFFNVAVVHCASIRLNGGDPTVSDGFKASMQHIGRIAVWALISATIGLILRTIVERSKIVGAIVARLLGAVWTVATYFIVPVMIFEKRSIKDSISESSRLIAKTWGESLVAAGGIGIFTMLLALAGLVLPIGGFFISPMAGMIGAGLMIAYWIALSIMTAALGGIYRTALYMYAKNGQNPPGFSPEYVQNAFATKGKKVAAFA